MTKVIFVLSSICSGLEFRSVDHSSIYENTELKVFLKIKYLDEISNDWPNDLLGTNIYTRLLNPVNNHCL